MLSREEFIAKVTDSDANTATPESWVAAAAGYIAMLAVNPESFSDVDIIGQLQELALKMPSDVLLRGMVAIDEVRTISEQFENLDPSDFM